LDNEEDLEIVFSGATICTNASAMALGPEEGSADANNDDDVEEVPHVTPDETQPKKRGAAHKSPTKKSKKNFRNMQFKRFVDSFVKKARSSKSSATSSPTDVVR
jgi:hypothetical protein